MSELDIQTWSSVLATPCTLLYTLIIVYKGIVDLSCAVFLPWTAEMPSANSDRLLTAYMCWVVLFSIEAQIAVVQCKKPVGRVGGTRGRPIMMVV